MYVVIAIPAEPKAKAINRLNGRARTTHGDAVIPSAAIVTRNAAEYSPPRMTAQPISPRATSAGDIGVASTVS
jgi:hypothetical protein